jgi:hypothetical protein
MAKKTVTGKRIRYTLEFYYRGAKCRIPSVGFTFENETNDGIPMDILDSPEYEAFSKAAHVLCKKLVEAGELN